MITLSNLRTEQAGEWTRLICDFAWDGDIPNPFTEKAIWFAVKNENADFFSTKVYDPFLLVPFYVAMRYGQDLKICGKVSARLYHNLTNYVQRIFLDFSNELCAVKLEVEGFDTVEQDGALVGAGFSCGVDSLSTVYDHFVKETVPGYKINALFIFNCGGNGYIEKDSTRELFLARYARNKRAADALGLPLYQVGSNLHAYTGVLGIYALTFLSNWSCVLSQQKKVQKFYVASGFSFEDCINHHKKYYSLDLDGFSGIYLVPRVQTETLEMIYDGAQHRRSEKVNNIANWETAQKHINVCLREDGIAENCSGCEKCLRTLMPIEALGKLNDFAQVFDLDEYKKHRYRYLCEQLALYHINPFAKDNIDFAREHQMKLPPVWFAYLYVDVWRGIKRAIKRLIGAENVQKLKAKFSRNNIS